ncbi:hypothetical protein [Acinetobacter baumannii]|uniref:hypothetical protein n=1 Tax=Acinetobacter baumannii TaxID=470 RepID=UPI002949A551|nr:hypothetical protein [Acinetobacter baumannii]MDV5203778.1 hypothetical protein [Acinetobacter baumannii]
MSKIENVDNFDDETLNELFAELDEQNLLIEEEEQKKKAKTETVSADDIHWMKSCWKMKNCLPLNLKHPLKEPHR